MFDDQRNTAEKAQENRSQRDRVGIVIIIWLDGIPVVTNSLERLQGAEIYRCRGHYQCKMRLVMAINTKMRQCQDHRPAPQSRSADTPAN